MRTVPALVLAAAIGLPLLSLHAQQPKQKAAGPGPAEREAAAMAEPFRGITANGTVESGLFKVKSTGVSTDPVRQAALAFLGALTPEQRAKTKFPVDDPEWRKWMNVHRWPRQGVSFLEMSEAQRAAAFGLMRASLSAKGLKLSQDIMKLNHTLAELKDDFVELGEWLYHLTVMGEPSADQPWGWQIDGHHLAINYFVLRDQVVMSPVFVGSEPVIAKAGKYKGIAILQDEQNRGLALRRSLTEAQRKKAVLEVAKTDNSILAQAFKDNIVLDYAGVAASDLTRAHAQVKMDEVRAQLDRTYFAWIGGDGDDSVFYYRIHSPVVMIEFDHERPANLRHLAADPTKVTREHIHSVVRTPNGNDYGKDLLRQHYATQKH
jgi:hypothetical protein